jgi:3-isopropylmalate/(R)-2-methylmalate dehydratase small subunit
MVLYGTTHRVGDGVTTEDILPHELRGAGDPALLAAHCLATLAPTIAEAAREGDVLLAGHSFGSGGDADAAVLALQALGFAAVICAGADAEFAETAAAYGLPVLISSAAANIRAGAIVRIDLASGTITDRSNGAVVQTAPCPPELVAAARRAQLLVRMRRVVDEEGFDG